MNKNDTIFQQNWSTEFYCDYVYKSAFLTNFDFNLKNINLNIILNKFMRVIIFKIMALFNFLKIVICKFFCIASI